MKLRLIRVPEIYYIKALLANKLNASKVVDELELLKLPVPTTWLKQIWENMRDTNLPYFEDTTAKQPDEEWLDEQGILQMYCYKFDRQTDVSLRGAEGAFRILEDTLSRRAIFVMAFAGISPIDIELIINSKYNISYESDDFTQFIHYFANFEGWTQTEKELYLTEIKDLETQKFCKLSLTRNDRYYLVWKLGLGVDPTSNFDGMLREMFVDSYFTFKDNLKLKPDDAQKFANLAIKINDRIEDINNAKQEDQDLLGKLNFKLVVEKSKKSSNDKDSPIVDTSNGATPEILDASRIDFDLPRKDVAPIPNLKSLMDPE